MEDVIGRLVETADGVLGMTPTEADIFESVRDFVTDPTGPADRMLEALLATDRTSTVGQSAVRYMMNVGAWRLELTGDFPRAMDHLFAHYAERPKVDPNDYRSQTSDLIRKLWGHDIPFVFEEPKVEAPKAKAPAKAKSKPARKAYTEPDEEAVGGEKGASGSRKFKSIREQDAEPKRKAKGKVDTTGASERLKKVIDIQRNG